MNTTTTLSKHAITAAALAGAGSHAPKSAATDLKARIKSSADGWPVDRSVENQPLAGRIDGDSYHF